MCTSPGGRNKEGTGGVIIVTPTIELAVQIRREVDALWPPQPPNYNGSDAEAVSALLVVGANENYGDETESSNDDNNEDEGESREDKDGLTVNRRTLQ